MTTAVAQAKATAVSADVLDDIFDHAGEGASFDSSEMIIPFVRLAQSLSPQINKKKPEYIEGLLVGDAYNNVTGEWWSGEAGLVVVPCYQVTKYLEFVPRESGGGFVGEIPSSDPRIQNTQRVGSKEILPNGNELVKSDQHFCLILGEDGMFQPAVVDMKSTQLKVSRRWKTQIAMKKMRHPTDGRVITPPVYASKWRLRAVEESNDKGDFYNWVVEPEGTVDNRDLLVEAKMFRDSVMSGAVKAAAEEHPEAYRPDDKVQDRDDEIPF
jgi:hypothetical protein